MVHWLRCISTLLFSGRVTHGASEDVFRSPTNDSEGPFFLDWTVPGMADFSWVICRHEWVTTLLVIGVKCFAFHNRIELLSYPIWIELNYCPPTNPMVSFYISISIYSSSSFSTSMSTQSSTTHHFWGCTLRLISRGWLALAWNQNKCWNHSEKLRIIIWRFHLSHWPTIDPWWLDFQKTNKKSRQ